MALASIVSTGLQKGAEALNPRAPSALVCCQINSRKVVQLRPLGGSETDLFLTSTSCFLRLARPARRTRLSRAHFERLQK